VAFPFAAQGDVVSSLKISHASYMSLPQFLLKRAEFKTLAAVFQFQHVHQREIATFPKNTADRSAMGTYAC
jgi:hypothetical protein